MLKTTIQTAVTEVFTSQAVPVVLALLYVFAVCPMNHTHTQKSSSAMQLADKLTIFKAKAIDYKCRGVTSKIIISLILCLPPAEWVAMFHCSLMYQPASLLQMLYNLFICILK